METELKTAKKFLIDIMTDYNHISGKDSLRLKPCPKCKKPRLEDSKGRFLSCIHCNDTCPF